MVGMEEAGSKCRVKRFIDMTHTYMYYPNVLCANLCYANVMQLFNEWDASRRALRRDHVVNNISRHRTTLRRATIDVRRAHAAFSRCFPTLTSLTTGTYILYASDVRLTDYIHQDVCIFAGRCRWRWISRVPRCKQVLAQECKVAG